MNKTIPITSIFILTIVFVLGQTAYGLDQQGQLVVSNIGSSGDDGVQENIGSSGEDGVNQANVPTWIKTSMQFWVDGHTSDAEFLSAVEFLANERIIQVDEKMNMGEVIPKLEIEQTTSAQAGNTDAGTVQTEILSMDLSSHDSFFDIFYETYTVDSFFDIFTEMQHTTDSFFDVFFDVETPRTNECLRGQELVFDERSSSWKCTSANTVDSFFDVFFDVATETSQNTEDVEELERKITLLEERLAAAEREMKESGEKGGTADINIGVGELQE